MAHIVTEITSFDNKRNKVTLDYGEVTFLLYKGECRRLRLTAQTTVPDTDLLQGRSFNAKGESLDDAYSDSVSSYGSKKVFSVAAPTADNAAHADGENVQQISDETYRSIIDDILLPRAKKRVLYYLKSADKTREQIRRKLREGFYPEEVIEETFKFLDRYGFADDDRYAEQYAEELKGSKSRREIALKLKEKGFSRDKAADIIAGFSDEDEYEACENALRKKYTRGISISREDRQKVYAYLARRGFSYEAIEHAMAYLSEEAEGSI